jgi:uncharacterized protein (DUF362 family)
VDYEGNTAIDIQFVNRLALRVELLESDVIVSMPKLKTPPPGGDHGQD